MDILEVTAQVDLIWSQRVVYLQHNNSELQPLIYRAWQIFEGRVGAPKNGAITFSGWLADREISRSTGYAILNRERSKLQLSKAGQLPGPKPVISTRVKKENGPAPKKSVERSDLSKKREILELKIRQARIVVDVEAWMDQVLIDAMEALLSTGKKKATAEQLSKALAMIGQLERKEVA